MLEVIAPEPAVTFQELGDHALRTLPRGRSATWGTSWLLETIRGKRGISIAASEIVRATATPRVLVSSRRYLVRRAAVTRIVGPRFWEIASTHHEARVRLLRPGRSPR